MKEMTFKDFVLNQVSKHPRFVRYIRFNMFGLMAFVLATVVYAIFLYSLGPWWAWIGAGFVGGLFEFYVQNRWVYANKKLFGKINQRLSVVDDFLLLGKKNKCKVCGTEYETT